MLVRLERTLPRGTVWRSEPKLDGFRGLLWRAPSGSVHLLSRNLKDLSNAFPELVSAGRDLPLETLIDGEIVIADAERQSNFGVLQERLGRAKRAAAREALHSPAVLLAFDMVRDAGAELIDQPLRERRRRLEALLGPGRAYLQLVPHTASVQEAEEWLRFVPGLEGVVAKRCDGRYVPGQRDWVKVKR
jgi:ATP-dependent DNA ligase